MSSLLRNPFIISAFVFLSGSLCALGMAPYNVWPVFLVGFGVLYWTLSKAQSKKAAFGYGWLWAFGYFIFSLYWIGNALLVDGNPYKWAWPLAVCGLPALLAFFNGFACLIAHRYCSLKTFIGYLGFVSLLSSFEFLRGHLFTGFPWNLYGYTWVDTSIAQLAAFESVYSLTFLTLFWLGVLGFFISAQSKWQKYGTLAVVLVSMASAYWYGFNRIPPRTLQHTTHIKIVQPNTPQHEKWQREKMDKHFENALQLSQPDGSEDAKTLIIWPETTLSPTFLNTPYYRDRIAEVLGQYKHEAILMTGALRYQPEDKTYHNSLLTINKSGQIDRIYDKSHLVPFGEYIPFQKWIPLAPVTQFQGFAKGEGLQTFELFDGLSYSPLVCYEIIFPNKTTPKDSQPDFIVNVTNDAWYGDSPGPHQHLVKARFRAIEEGMPVFRAANTGISAIIDSYGRILSTSDTFTQKVLNSRLPFQNAEK